MHHIHLYNSILLLVYNYFNDSYSYNDGLYIAS